MNKSSIEWTDWTSNPLYALNRETGRRGWFCEKVSPGCAHCYSSTQNRQQLRGGTGYEFLPGNREHHDFVLNENELREWSKPRYAGQRCFAFDMTDLFGEWVSDEWLAACFQAMADARDVTFQILTKRPERMRAYMTRWLFKATVEREEDQRLWGQTYRGTPRLLDKKFGDGKQLIAFVPLNSRPNYYVVHVGSDWSLENDAEGETVFDHADEICEALEEEFGPARCSYCRERYGQAGCEECKDEPESEGEWPHVDADIGASWGSYEPSVIAPLPNVWLGVTVENQRWADERIPILLDTPAAVRFVSAEPLLGPVDLTRLVPEIFKREKAESANFPDIAFDGLTGLVAGPDEYPWGRDGHLDWVIVGGESGPKHRAFDPAWARSIVAQCKDAGVAAFVKQLGGARPGTALEDLPVDLQVREFPMQHGEQI